MTALEQLGAYVAHGAQRVPPDIIALLRLHVADTIGAWIAATPTAEGRALSRFQAAAQPEAGDRTGDMLRDVAVNCALARLSEIDDIHLASMTTPGGIVVPAALTLVQAPNAARDSLAPAIIVGYEAMIRFGLAIQGPMILYRGLWPTYLAAPFATAAVAARLLGLNASQSAHALALALTLASPGVGHHGAATTARWFAVGQAARNGLTAALAAQQGFTSDLDILDGAFLHNVYDIKLDPSALVDRLGERHALAEVSFKPWCAARQTMAATFGLTQLMDDGLAADDITDIKVLLPSPHVKMVDHGVTNGDRASHLTSVPYQLAIAAIMPEAAYDVVQSPAAISDELRAFMDKVKVESDESLLLDYPRLWRAHVRIASRKGPRESDVSHVPGDPDRAFDSGDIKAKFRRFVGPVLGGETTERMLECSLSALEHQQSRRLLMQELRRASAH
jgi:2-methylcitrate dehydratase PrpD